MITLMYKTTPEITEDTSFIRTLLTVPTVSLLEGSTVYDRCRPSPQQQEMAIHQHQQALATHQHQQALATHQHQQALATHQHQQTMAIQQQQVLATQQPLPSVEQPPQYFYYQQTNTDPTIEEFISALPMMTMTTQYR